MKRLFTLLFFLSFLSSFSQNFPLLEDNKKWISSYYEYSWNNGNPIPDRKLQGVYNQCLSNEDTVINNITYRKLNRCKGSYDAALREEGQRVFIVPSEGNTEYLLYDFGANKGDTLKVYYRQAGMFPSVDELVVNHVDMITINGKDHKRLHFMGAEWIEGIGNTNGFMMESWPNVSNYQVVLECAGVAETRMYPEYSEGETCADIHMSVNENEAANNLIFPNPASDFIYLDFETGSADQYSLYDLQGKLITTDSIKDKSINATGLSAGSYILVITKDNNPLFRTTLIKN